MLKNLLKGTVVASCLMAASSNAFASGDGKANIKEYTYNIQSAWATMVVTSSDGSKWDGVQPGNLQFWAHMKIDTRWPGAVNSVGVVLGNCSGASCKSFPILWSKSVGERDFNHQRNFSVSTGLLSGTTAGLAQKRQEIIETCNAHLAPDGATKRHEFQSSLSTTFVADTDKRDLGQILAQAEGDSYIHPAEIDHAKSGDFTFNVVCKPHVKISTTDDLKFEHGDLKVNDIELFLSTFSGATTQPNPATTCKKGRILVRVKTNKAGPTKFKLWTKIGGSTTSKVVDAWASHDGSGGYKAEHTEWVEVNGPTQIQAMAEELVSDIGQTTQWKELMLHCSNAPNGGGFVQDTIPPDNVLPDATYSGEITVADSALTPKNQCPRQGQAVFEITSNKSAAVDYKVDCTGGRSWTGTMQMFANGPGKFKGTAAKTFDVEKTENVACVLKRVDGNQHIVLSFSGKQFTCANPTMPPSTTDLTPNAGRPEEPPVNVQTLTGDFGIADHGAPKCPRKVKALVTFKSPKADNIHYSLDCKYQNKSGVVTPQPSPQGGYMAATLVSLDVTQTLNDSCTLRTVAPYGPKDHVTREHQFVCATPSGHGATSDLKPEPPQQPDSPSTGGTGTVVGNTTAGICVGKVCDCRDRAGWTTKHFKKFQNGMPIWAYRCIPGASDDKTTDTGNADRQRIDALKIAKDKAEAERLRRAKIAAELAAKRKRQLEAARKARLLKLQQERARKAAAAAAKARANALRAFTAKRTNKVKVAPRRRTTTAPVVNRMMMMRVR